MKSFYNVQYSTLFDLQVDNDLVENIAIFVNRKWSRGREA